MANTTMNISLPQQMREWIDFQIESGEYSNNSDYVRDLIRRDKKHREKIEAMQSAITQGIESGSAGVLNIDDIKKKAKKRVRAAAKNA